MRQNKMLTNFLLLGSFLICIITSGCNKQNTDYVFNADWVYTNNTSYDIEIDGIEHFSLKEDIDISIAKDKSHIIEFRSFGGKEIIDPKGYPFPVFKQECKLIINDKTYIIKDGVFIRSIDNYVVKKINDRHCQFTYIFTDDIINEILAK